MSIAYSTPMHTTRTIACLSVILCLSMDSTAVHAAGFRPTLAQKRHLSAQPKNTYHRPWRVTNSLDLSPKQEIESLRTAIGKRNYVEVHSDDSVRHSKAGNAAQALSLGAKVLAGATGLGLLKAAAVVVGMIATVKGVLHNSHAGIAERKIGNYDFGLGTIKFTNSYKRDQWLTVGSFLIAEAASWFLASGVGHAQSASEAALYLGGAVVTAVASSKLAKLFQKLMPTSSQTGYQASSAYWSSEVPGWSVSDYKKALEATAPAQ